jgi:hypothetical protein
LPAAEPFSALPDDLPSELTNLDHRFERMDEPESTTHDLLRRLRLELKERSHRVDRG